MAKVDIENLQKSELYQKAKSLLIESGEVSTELFQRQFKVGYTTAYRLLDLLSEEGISTPPQGVDPSVVLVKK
jgi:S-DNA-T family DNA segregation ATPase FtsK/SpoIIIE